MAIFAILRQLRQIFSAPKFIRVRKIKNCKKTNFIVSLCVDILAECTKRRVVGRLSNLISFLGTVYVFFFLFFIFFIFYLFLLVFYFRISFLYITDFNLKIKILLLHYGLENGRMPWKQKY